MKVIKIRIDREDQVCQMNNRKGQNILLMIMKGFKKKKTQALTTLRWFLRQVNRHIYKTGMGKI